MTHPLDPLSVEEIEEVTKILENSGRTADCLYLLYRLNEPRKDVVLNFKKGDSIEREAFALLRNDKLSKTIEVIVSLSKRAILSWEEIAGAIPPFVYSDLYAAQKATKKSPEYIKALSLRGITDLDRVVLYPWTPGYRGPLDSPSEGRLLVLATALSSSPGDNYYAHPIEGILVTVKVYTGEVRVEDFGVVPIPTLKGNYSPESIKDPDNFPYFPNGVRKDLKPIVITQPEGTSYTVEGNEVNWQKWRFRVGFTPREGLVLHLLEYFDKDHYRPLIYRAALSEMYVPYGDTNPGQGFKNVFDCGECGIGYLANSLRLGCDCLGVIHYFDAIVNSSDGSPTTIKNAVCLHEEDHGMLWKHTEHNEGPTRVEVRRSRRLVLSTISTLGNYEYGFYWYLYLDGTIEYQVKLTGILAPAAITPGKLPFSGGLMHPGVYGPNHQHFFNVRMDVNLDGPNNSVSEVNIETLPDGDDNPFGNAWIAKESPLVEDTNRPIEPRTGRYWKIINRDSLNCSGQPVGYKLVPGANSFFFCSPTSSRWKRGGFAHSHFWATAFDPKELYAGGNYPYQQARVDGLPKYLKKRSLDQKDIVVWYTFGATHVTRSEDWPVMPVEMLGFHLKPVGFFDGNPSLDVPPTQTFCFKL
eukprot:TRINITY_DN9233_c0_g1_i3.p1 TRINITY_DN9233_c0_g1~~TRINITY_DN9233_c0_g1_i3.p1  ORF type:complete len:661 (-),score=113.39 TRINITY_DN9233_c0_g1_i3:103-2019(-)